MKRKCTSLSFVLVILLFPFLKNYGQTTLSFTTPSYSAVNPLPIGYQYQYSYSQCMYMPYLFNVTEGSITRIRYYWSGGTAVPAVNNNLTNSNYWTIYMGHRQDSTFTTTTSWVPLNELTQVYSDSFLLTGPGWVEFVLDTPFAYNASLGNLVIAVDENAPGVSYTTALTSTGFRSGSLWVSPNFKSIYRYSNTLNIDPSAPGTASSRVQHVNHLQIVILPPTVLPITLKEFKATNAGKFNLLQWTSMQDDLHDTYIVERSSDGKKFTEIASLDAKGLAKATYNFTDESPFTGVNYYRLRLQDQDGKVNFSTVETAVVRQGGFQVKLYPNPAKDKVMLVVEASSGKPVIQLCDLLGQTVKTFVPEKTGSTSIDIGFLPSGTYILKYADQAHQEVLKFVKE